MVDDIKDLTVNYEEDGKQVVKELDKQYLSKGSWSTVMFLYQELDRKTDEYGEPKVTIRRYQKVYGEFRQRSKFNISSTKQASKIVDILNDWFKLK